MKKRIWGRIGIGFLQHLLAAAIAVAAGGLSLNSYLAVDSIDGTQVFEIFPLEDKRDFEDSEIYNSLFRSAVSDITQLVVIKAQLETKDVFDPSKKIDVTAYAKQLGIDQDCAVTVFYELDHLINWGKRGIDYTDRTMSMSDFVNYFGYCIYPENFRLNSFGQLVFDRFYRTGDFQTPQRWEGTQETQETQQTQQPQESVPAQGRYGKTAQELEALAREMETYTQEQLEDMVFSYLMAQDLDEVRLSREDDGALTVSFPMLTVRYETADGSRQLVDYADNWVDYIRLQRNVAAAVENLTVNYDRYRLCNPAYRSENSNVRYMVRLTTAEGVQTYTNMEKLKEASDEDVTEFFSEYRRYLIYYPDSLAFMGNTGLTEDELYGYIKLYEYAYPDTTHIWLGVDTDYPAVGDAFYNAHQIYERVVPYANRILFFMGAMSLLWLVIGVYRSVVTGMAFGEDGSRVWRLNRFDHLWTECLFLLGAGAIYLDVRGFRLLGEVARTAGVIPREWMGIQLTRLYHYGVFALYGLFVSVSVCVVWYSLVRRAKAWSLWRGSLLYGVFSRLQALGQFILRHKNTAVSTLLPYNLYLFFNLVSIAAVYRFRSQRFPAAAILLGLLAFDGAVGVLLFKRNGEQRDIVEGINRIRDGEVDFKLDTRNLHGSSKEMADAVNNIGEGIRKAVRTSMKDEQMKTDLITNVSHDLKTPLTSIINYVDLLKRLKIKEEPARSYIDILDGKAQRLKQLTDDLVEASKISSGNIELNREKLNLTELIHQSLGEFSEKLEEKKLQVIFDAGEGPAYIYADSRRMWRVMENLFNNICKYALEGTRVYIDIATGEDTVEVSFKNISKQRMNIRPQELTERFIRGDSSRSTEGSGLGLSIAKNLVQAQEGEFHIFLDGDLFKVTIGFSLYRETENPPKQDSDNRMP